MTKNVIKIFLSSSLKLKEERMAFLETFKAAEDDDTQFEVYAHEINGVMRIVSGSDSQTAINAAALGCDAFITYAGDRIGNATIEELLHELADAKSLFKFIYVLHQPGLVTDAMQGDGYVDWNEFYCQNMRDGQIKYYENELPRLTAENADERREECLNNIRAKAAVIARELRSKRVPELYPAMLNYSKVISQGQSSYRKALDFYFHRSVDDSIREVLCPKVASDDSKTPAVLTIVSGTSLAGKTRAVTEALKRMPADTHIHILPFNERAEQNLMSINPELQFGNNSRNILFVDDLHKLLDTDSKSEVPGKFMEICRFAETNPGRLHIVATSIYSTSELIKILRRFCTADSWLNKVATIEIEALSQEEVMQVLRQLRRKGKLESLGKIKMRASSVPLGSLFIDLSRMQNYYSGAIDKHEMLALLFDAIKTLWLWKRRSRGDLGLLLKFISEAYKDCLDEALTRDRLIELLRLIPGFVMLTGRFKWKMIIEEILVNEVFQFEVSENIDNAIARLVGYISL